MFDINAAVEEIRMVEGVSRARADDSELYVEFDDVLYVLACCADGDRTCIHLAKDDGDNIGLGEVKGFHWGTPCTGALAYI